MTIPIQNLYYLLLYAWDRLEEGRIAPVSEHDTTSVGDLFARVLSGSVSHALKRGMERDYVTEHQPLRGIRGRVDFSETAKRNLRAQGLIACSFDELSFDVPRNQIIRSTIRLLLSDNSLDRILRERLRDVLRRMGGVSIIPLDSNTFRSALRSRNGRYYDFLLKVCRIIYENLLVDPATGLGRFRDFVRDEKKMGKVFELFVFNFFRREQWALGVDRPQIRWTFTPKDVPSEAMLPQMKTDVVLTSGSSSLLLETKYTKTPHQEFYGATKLRSDHLYQIATYMTQWPAHHPMNAAMLYASIGDEFRYTYHLGGRTLTVLSLDLAQPWQAIHSDLMSIATLLPKSP